MKTNTKPSRPGFVFWGIVALIGFSFYLINEQKVEQEINTAPTAGIPGNRTDEVSTAQASKRFSQETDPLGHVSIPFSRLISTSPVNDLLVDPTGKLWAATESGVTSVFNDQVKHYSIEHGRFPYPQAQCLAHDGQTLWVGSLFGLCRQSSGESFKIVENLAQLPSQIVWSLCWDGATIWLGTQNGIAFMDKNNEFQIINDSTSNRGLRHNWNQSILRVSNWLIAAHDRGISLWNTSFPASNPEWWKNIDNSRSGIIRPINDMTYDGRNVWIATSRGVLLLNTPMEKFFSETLNNIISYSRIHGLPTNRVNSLLAHRGSIWLGTEEGLARIKDERVQIVSDSREGQRRRIRKLAISGDILWIGSDMGIQFINTAMVE